jgi:reductive dehalogenase
MRFDERDIMFARINYEPGTKIYEEYYKKHPEKKEMDDFLRSLPGFMVEEAFSFDPLNSGLINGTYNFLGDLKKNAEGEVKKDKYGVDKDEISHKLKSIAKYYGADLVGITKMEDVLYYTNRGREPKNHGEKVTNKHKYGIVFAVELKKDMVNRAPRLGQSLETSKGYVKAGMIGMILSYYIRELGYEARNHMDGNYLLMAPFTAESAGLGQIGRMGILVTKEYGPRVRLGVVTTDLELNTDQRVDFGMKEFCKICNKCAENCPSGAIDEDSPKMLNNEMRWKTEVEKCFKVWQMSGTDCGICISSCPFSQELDIDKINQMKDNPKLIKDILREYNKENKERPYNESEHEWL